MKKKIVILNGSPRPNGNTKALIDQFTSCLLYTSPSPRD